MSFLDSLRKIFTGGSNRGSGGSSFGGGDANTYWLYAKCRRCGEPLMGRVNMLNELSQEEDDTWVVRKQLSGSGGVTTGSKNYCFQTIEVALHFDSQKKNLLNADVTGGTLITAEEYARLLEEQQQAAARAQEEAAAADAAVTPSSKEE